MKIGRIVSELIYPSDIKCIICGDDLPRKNRYNVCDRCELAFNVKFCLTCGRAMKNLADYCDECQNDKHYYDLARAPLRYEDEVVTIVHRLKYGGAKYLAETFAQFMADTFFEEKLDADLITFVPMHKSKQKSRGYNQAEEIVTLDQKLNVVILDFDDEKKRIALGLKQLTPHPWDALSADLKVGDTVKGKVVVMADYGAFVEIAPGVEGLIHVSEMSWSQHLRSAQDFMKVGDEVEAVVLTLDRDERKMSLGIKQLKSDPWQNIEEKYGVGTKHTATVRNFTNFGVFVEIEEGVDGLIHISDLSWTKKVKHPAEFTQIGAPIEVVVLEIDKENRRLSLGHKQLEENPWDVFETIFTVDSVHEGTITEIFDKGAVVALPYGVEGFATPRHLVKEDGSQAKVDEKLEFKVIEFNKAAKRIIVSHSRVFEDAQKSEEKAKKNAEEKSTKKAVKQVKEKLEKTTLGDITELAALKEQMTADAAAAKEENKD